MNVLKQPSNFLALFKGAAQSSKTLWLVCKALTALLILALAASALWSMQAALSGPRPTLTAEEAKGRFLELADRYFEEHSFEQAAAAYEQYLLLAPKDINTKGRYAVCLAFSTKPDKAISILQELLSSKANDFHFLAYLAIAYAQKGETTKALDVAQKALANAPDEEAKSRINDFIETYSKQ